MLKKLIAENLYLWERESLAPPVQISITPTNLCNLKCQSCWQRDEIYHPDSHKKPAEIPKQKLSQIIGEANELGVRCIELTGGGEPLARKQTTVRLINEIKNRGMIGWMTSNGTLFSTDIIKLMVELGWDKLTISLDGPDADTNDFLRPPAGTFEKILKTISLFNEYKRILNKNKPEITFNVVVSKYNISKLSEIVELASKMGVEGVTFEPIKILTNECKQLLVDFEREYNIVEDKLKKAQHTALRNNIFTNIDGLVHIPELIRYTGKLTNRMPTDEVIDEENRLSNAPCFEPWFHIYLEADGNVRPCCVSEGLGENIHYKSLKDIWFGKKFSSFRNTIISRNFPLSCNQCNANLICFSREIQELLKEKLLRESAKHPLENIPPNSLKAQMLKDVSQKQTSLLITDTASLYPPLWGGPKRIWNLYSNFSQELFDITYVGVDFSLKKDLRYSFDRIRDNFKQILCTVPPHYYLWCIFEKAFFKNTSFDLFIYLWMHTDLQFKHILNSHNADIIICSHPWSSLSIHKKSGQLFIYDAHNCEYVLMDKILQGYAFRKFVLKQIKKIEGNACKKSDLILVCSEKEKEEFINLYGIDKRKFYIVSNGTIVKSLPTLEEKVKAKKKLGITANKIILFIGAFYKPNIEAVEFIITSLAKEFKKHTFYIVGTVKDAFKNSFLPENVYFTGWLSEEKLDFVLKASDIAINPIFNGSGINIKILDYLVYGLPTVTSPCGSRGLKAEHMKNMLIVSFDDFKEAIQTLFENALLYNTLRVEGYKMVSENYNWATISKNLEDKIIDLTSSYKL